MRKMKRAIYKVLSIFFTYSDMPLIHNVLERKHPGQERGEGSAVVQCCRGTLLTTSRIQLQHDANHLTGKLTQLQAQSPLSRVAGNMYVYVYIHGSFHLEIKTSCQL